MCSCGVRNPLRCLCGYSCPAPTCARRAHLEVGPSTSGQGSSAGNGSGRAGGGLAASRASGHRCASRAKLHLDRSTRAAGHPPEGAAHVATLVACATVAKSTIAPSVSSTAHAAARTSACQTAAPIAGTVGSADGHHGGSGWRTGSTTRGPRELPSVGIFVPGMWRGVLCHPRATGAAIRWHLRARHVARGILPPAGHGQCPAPDAGHSGA